MIAPDPTLAGPLPAAPQREASRAAPAERRGGKDFGSLLELPPAEEPELPEGGKEAAPAAPAAPDPLQALAAPVAAAPAPRPAEAASDEPAADVLAAAVAAREPALPPPVPATGPGTPERSGRAVVAAAAPAVASTAAAATGQGTRPAVRPALAAPEAGVEERPVAGAAREPDPGRERIEARALDRAPVNASAEAKTAGRTEPAAPLRAGNEEGRGVAIADADPPAWQLRPDGPAPARSEPAPPVPAQPPMPAIAPQAVAAQLVVAIGRASDESVELRLDPPELGRVQIHLSRHDGAVQAVVLADRPETQDLLRRHAEVLARELGEAGYDSVRLDFSGGGAQPRPDDTPARDWGQVAHLRADEPGAPRAPQAPRAPGRLDVRL